MVEQPKCWAELSRKKLLTARIFEVFARRMRSPDGSFEDDFYHLQARDWTNIIPITSQNNVVLIEQYRHGIDGISLEVPGGIIDEEETDAACAAKRELLEETGYSIERIESLGSIHPNPAIMSNRCHFFVGHGAHQTGEQALDPAEDIRVVEVPLASIKQMLINGQISHCLIACAFLQYFLRAEQGVISQQKD